MRVLLIVMDSVGVGNAPDAVMYGDRGADTLRHILKARPETKLPALWSMGLGHILRQDPVARPVASYGTMCAAAAGKDSTTGHWELAGVILDKPFRVYRAFPADLVSMIEREAGVQFLGNIPASGTQIIEDLGEEHLRTARPILYTSADSVLQIAAHETILPLEELYRICRIARKHADGYRIGRVIARPFIGEPGHFQRTAGRHDFSLMPPPTVLNQLSAASIPVISIGKTFDLFAGSGMTQAYPTTSNAEGMQCISDVWPSVTDGLVFANLVDFDAMYGHRRDVDGYAKALVEFDTWLGRFLTNVRSDDLLILTADHGNDPTYPGTDHTREQVPLLVQYDSVRVPLGSRPTFADVAATLAAAFSIEEWPVGVPVLDPALFAARPARATEGSEPRRRRRARPGQADRGKVDAPEAWDSQQKHPVKQSS